MSNGLERTDRDPIDVMLVEAGIQEDELSVVRGELRDYFARLETPDKPIYLSSQDGAVLTAATLAAELEKGTPRAKAFVKLWIAGNLSDPDPPQTDLARKFRDRIRSR